MERLILYESYFRIFWKRQNSRDVKNVSSYQEIGITKEGDKQVQYTELKALKYPTQSYNGGCMTI